MLSSALSVIASLTISGAALPEPPQARPEPAVASSTPAAINTDPLVHEAVINAPPEELWRVFTTGDGLKNLGAAKGEVDLRVGGIMRSHYNPQGVLGDDGTIQNRIIAFEPLRVFSFRIDKPPAGFPFKEAWKDVWSVATFTDLGDGRTTLRLAMCGYSADPESQAMRQFFDNGNAWVMKKLQSRYDSSVSLGSGAAHADDPLAPIDLHVLVPAPCAEVWRAYSTAEGWKAFNGARLNIELRPGGPFEVWFNQQAPEGERGSEGCTVLSVDPGRMLSYSWNAPPKFPFARTQHSWVVVTFDEVSGNLTRVNLRHLGFADLAKANPDHAQEFKDTRAYFSQAWPKILGALKSHFEPASAAASVPK